MAKGIRKNGNRYQGRFMMNGKNYSVTADTITECRRMMEELRTKLRSGGNVFTEKLTFDEWFWFWLEEYKRHDLKEGTMIAYQNYYRFYIKETLGEKRLNAITGEDIQRLYNQLLADGLALSTVRVISAMLGGCFHRALINQKIASNPVKLAQLPRQKQKNQRQVLTLPQQRAFMEAAKGSYLFHLFELMLRTGMRGGEVRGLKFTDIDRERSVIHIQRTLKYEAGRGFFEDAPKTSASAREIPLTEEIRAILAAQRQENRALSNVVALDEYVFHLPNGRPISRERLQAEIDRTIQRAAQNGTQIPRFTAHCFRHTFATRAIEAGMQPQTLKTILGHSTLSMTMDLYSHVLPNTRADEMERISEAF